MVWHIPRDPPVTMASFPCNGSLGSCIMLPMINNERLCSSSLKFLGIPESDPQATSQTRLFGLVEVVQ